MSKHFALSRSPLHFHVPHYSSILHLAVAFNGFHFTKKIVTIALTIAECVSQRKWFNCFAAKKLCWKKSVDIHEAILGQTSKSRRKKTLKIVVKVELLIKRFLFSPKWTRGRFGRASIGKQNARWLSLLPAVVEVFFLFFFFDVVWRS